MYFPSAGQAFCRTVVAVSGRGINDEAWVSPVGLARLGLIDELSSVWTSGDRNSAMLLFLRHNFSHFPSLSGLHDTTSCFFYEGRYFGFFWGVIFWVPLLIIIEGTFCGSFCALVEWSFGGLFVKSIYGYFCLEFYKMLCV